ncbi:OmpA family protein [Streptomonospora halophila]|uniref:OmpA family protein n=1 Tax=Streptomonospora halophila TaxID=427369 RepID=UPI0031EBD5D5
MILRRITALTVSALLLVGLPYTGLVLLDWPALDLSITAVLAHLRGGALPPGLGPAALILALWAVWGLYLSALIGEVSAWLRGRTPRLRPLGPLQVLAATAIGATLATPAAHAATPSSTAVTETPTTDPEPAPTAPGDLPGSEAQVIERERVVDDFGYDTADLTTAMKDELAPVVSMIRTNAASEKVVRVTGHTDAAGDATYNQQLSQRRADAIADYLHDQLGNAAPPIESYGKGESQLLEGANAASQRRVQVTYTVTPQPPTHPSDRPDPSVSEEEPETTPTAQETGHAETPNPESHEAVIVVKLPGGFVLTSMAASGVAAGFALGRRHRGAMPPAEPATTAPEKERASGRTAPAQPQSAPEEPADAPADVDASTVLDVSAGGAGIIGPGAPAAARSLLAAALTTDQEPPLHLIIPNEDAAALIGTETATLLVESATSRVRVTPTMSDALTQMHTELLARPDDEDDDATNGTHPEPPAPLLLMASPADDHTDELRALLAHGRRSGIAALLLGSWPESTCTITAEHTITTTDPSLHHLAGAHWPGTEAETLSTLIANLPAPTAHEKTPARLRVLGRITLTVANQPTALRRRAALEVGAYLAAQPDGATLERAVEDLWPGESTHRANRRFHDATSALRSVVTNHDQLVLYENGRYRLNPAVVTVDVWELQSLLTTVETTPSDARARAELHHAAAGFADFAAEADYPWAEEHRRHLRRRMLNALLRCAADSDDDGAHGLLTQAIAIDPYSEDAHHALIRLHLDNGDTHAATETYRQYESAMRQIDIEPSARIRDLLANAK